jgi:hypothetical protein
MQGEEDLGFPLQPAPTHPTAASRAHLHLIVRRAAAEPSPRAATDTPDERAVPWPEEEVLHPPPRAIGWGVLAAVGADQALPGRAPWRQRGRGGGEGVATL